MAFKGWPVEALEFFEGLEADNSKSYWQANKAVYESTVLAPMQELLAELEPAFGPGKIFRPYRDIRFSADKTPYKTNVAATVGIGYIHLDARGLGAGSGMYMMASDQLERYRSAVDEDKTGKQLASIVQKAKGEGLEVTGHEMLKTVPRGYPKDHPRADLLKAKGLITWRDWPAGAWLGTRKAKDRIVEFLDLSKPLNRWLGKNVGESALSQRER